MVSIKKARGEDMVFFDLMQEGDAGGPERIVAVQPESGKRRLHLEVGSNGQLHVDLGS